MVCDRCKTAVTDVLRQNGLRPVSVELGVACVDGQVTPETRERLRSQLAAIGFELLDDRRQQLIDRIKSLIVDLVHWKDGLPPVNLSDYLSSHIHRDYSSLSKLFSETTSMTIERYYILQRVERVKELITYDELSLTQIALKMNYSSVAYLSSQFKQVTGMTPTQFKHMERAGRTSLDKL